MKKLIILVLTLSFFGLTFTTSNSTLNVQAASSSSATIQYISLNNTINFNDGTFGSLDAIQNSATISPLGFATSKAPSTGIILKANFSVATLAPLTLTFDWLTNVSQPMRLTYGQPGSYSFVDSTLANGKLVPGTNSGTISHTFTPNALTGRIQIAMFNDRTLLTDVQGIDNVRLSGTIVAGSSSSSLVSNSSATPVSTSSSAPAVSTSTSVTPVSTSSSIASVIVSTSSSSSSSATPVSTSSSAPAVSTSTSVTPVSTSSSVSSPKTPICVTPSVTTVKATLTNGKCYIYLCLPGIATTAAQCVDPSKAVLYNDTEYGPCILAPGQSFCNVPVQGTSSSNSIASTTSSTNYSSTSSILTQTVTCNNTNIVLPGSNQPSLLTVGGCLIYSCRSAVAFVSYSNMIDPCGANQTKVTFLDPQVTTCSVGYIFMEGTPNCVTSCPAGYLGSMNTDYVRNTFTCKLR
jgi:hypothetical protein